MGGHCVAGKDIVTKEWIRLVKGEKRGALRNEEAKCKNHYGIYPVKVLQKVEIGLTRHAPLINQPENYIIRDEIWLKRGEIDSNELDAYLDNPDILWSNESSSSQGINDRVDYNEVENKSVPIGQSLYLIRAEDIKIRRNIYDEKRLRIFFVYKDAEYNLGITDPILRKQFFNGEYSRETSKILCISLARKYEKDGFCYRLAIALF